VLTPTGLYNCPAHRGEQKALIAGPQAYRDDEAGRGTADGLLKILDSFDASYECREVTCLYNGVNWWIEKMIEDPREAIDLPPADERLDYFL
jgi:hypothetical protein